MIDRNPSELNDSNVPLHRIQQTHNRLMAPEPRPLRAPHTCRTCVFFDHIDGENGAL